MKRLMLHFLFIQILIGSTNAQIKSTFDLTTQGWTTVGDAPTIIHYDSLGNPGGYIKAFDLGNGITWYWIAPPDFLGIKSAYYGGWISFDMKTTVVNSTTTDDVKFTGNGISIFYTLPNPSTTVWTHYQISISDTSGWKKDSSGVLINADSLDIITVLDSLAEIKLRGEFSSVTGDQGSLDNVNLSYQIPLGISSVMNTHLEFNLFPNPVKDKLEINLSVNNHEKKLISIYNSLGNPVFETSMHANNLEINTSNLQTGLYIIKIGNEKEFVSMKFVKD